MRNSEEGNEPSITIIIIIIIIIIAFISYYPGADPGGSRVFEDTPKALEGGL